MIYVPLRLKLIELNGIATSLKAMRLPKDNQSKPTLMDDLLLASKLILAGDSHAKAMRGIIAYIELEMQAGFMIEFETYRHGVECLSTSSSMHNELKGLSGPELAEQKQQDLSSKVYKRIVTISYQALRHMYIERRNHRHPDWRIFSRFVEDLNMFDYLIYPERRVLCRG